jgi:hypothetical protein
MNKTNIRIHIVTECGSYEAEVRLEYQIQEFLKNNNINFCNLMDIKYSIALFTGTHFRYSAMIIYKED